MKAFTQRLVVPSGAEDPSHRAARRRVAVPARGRRRQGCCVSGLCARLTSLGLVRRLIELDAKRYDELAPRASFLRHSGVPNRAAPFAKDLRRHAQAFNDLKFWWMRPLKRVHPR